MISIEAIEVEIPPRLVRVDELPEVMGFTESDKAVFDRLGIATVADSDGAAAAELAILAARKLLERRHVDPLTVDALVVIESRVPEMFMASDAARIQQEIGTARATTFSVGQLGCVSVNAGLIAARALLESDDSMQRVLMVHGSQPPSPRRFRRPVTINGEGGVAVLIGRGAGIRILDLRLESNGEYWDLFQVVFKNKPVADWVEECKSLKRYSFKLAIESRNRFGALNDAMLKAHGLTFHEVEHFVMQNLSTGSFNFYEEFLNVRFAKACYENLEMYGHLGSMDILLNLATGLGSGEFAKGDRVLIMNNSPVAAWSTVLAEI